MSFILGLAYRLSYPFISQSPTPVLLFLNMLCNFIYNMYFVKKLLYK